MAKTLETWDLPKDAQARSRVVELTVHEVREYFDHPDIALPYELELVLDESQGLVYSGEQTETFILIKIVKEH
jgi:hypothetical protein